MYLETFLAFLIIERLLELYIAKKNSIYLQSIGGYEVGNQHYPIIVLLHISFLTSFYIEGSLKNQIPEFWYIPLSFFILAQILRFWIISSLGRYWNTRIYIIPNSKPIKKGPYKYLRHPNYLVVMLEMVTIPLIFGAYLTALIFPILNILVLFIRIKVEEKALMETTEYNREMGNVPRFVPRK